jgi:hypothetical protein
VEEEGEEVTVLEKEEGQEVIHLDQEEEVKSVISSVADPVH